MSDSNLRAGTEVKPLGETVSIDEAWKGGYSSESNDMKPKLIDSVADSVSYNDAKSGFSDNFSGIISVFARKNKNSKNPETKKIVEKFF